MKRRTAKSTRRRTKKKASTKPSKKSRKAPKQTSKKMRESSGSKKAAARGRAGTKSVPLSAAGASSPGQGVQIVAYKPGDPTKRLRDYFKGNKKNQPPNYTRIPHTERTPRIRQVTHWRTGRAGKYATLVLVPEDYIDSRIVTPPVPDIAIVRGWLYVNGSAPCVGTTAVVAQAEGCRLLLYYYTQSGHRYSRTCYLEGSPESLVWVYPDPDDRGKVGWLTPGTYTDADVDLSSTQNGKFLQWKDSSDGLPVVHDLATLNESTNPPTPTYAAVMAEVAQGIYNEPID